MKKAKVIIQIDYICDGVKGTSVVVEEDGKTFVVEKKDATELLKQLAIYHNDRKEKHE